jgi:hypothetical protein
MRRISEIDSYNPDCTRCDGTGWVCENHMDKPWADGYRYPGSHDKPGCDCGAGAPCPSCNALAIDHGDLPLATPRSG